MPQYIFKRYEKKYILSFEQYEEIKKFLSFNTVPDKHGKTDICNIYCDTDDFRIIRASIQKPVFKEKLRLRSYGVPDKTCFLELKKKYKGVVYKRRIKETYVNALEYISNISDNILPSQIKNEIEFFKKIHNTPTPQMNIFYEREAYFDRNDKNIRITFDRNLLFRDYELNLKNGIYGEKIIPEDTVIMEIKTIGGMPLWLTSYLTENRIFPSSFSKYGRAYLKSLSENKTIFLINGGNNNVR